MDSLLELEVEIQPIVDDAVIDSLIHMNTAIQPEGLGSAHPDPHGANPGAPDPILIPDAGAKVREKIEVPVLIESIGVPPRMDSPKPVKGD